LCTGGGFRVSTYGPPSGRSEKGALYVLQLAGLISLVRAEIEQAVAGEIEQEDAFLALFARSDSFDGHGRDRVRRFRRRHNTLRLREQRRVSEDLCLVIGFRLYQTKFERVTDHR